MLFYIAAKNLRLIIGVLNSAETNVRSSNQQRQQMYNYDGIRLMLSVVVAVAAAGSYHFLGLRTENIRITQKYRKCPMVNKTD